MSKSIVYSLAAAVTVIAASGCQRGVGDACETNVQCSALGDRFCDLSSEGGYCTVEGCDIRLMDTGEPKDSCPQEASCVRFFTQVLTRDSECDPLPAGGPAATGCGADERCLCDCTDPNDRSRCLPAGATCENGDKVGGSTGAHCAPETTERRWCMRRCEKDTDCRVGYECRAPGTGGAELVPILYEVPASMPGWAANWETQRAKTRFCAQRAK